MVGVSVVGWWILLGIEREKVIGEREREREELEKSMVLWYLLVFFFYSDFFCF